MTIIEVIMAVIGTVCSFVIAFAKKKRFWIPAMVIYWGLIITALFIK